MKYHLVLILSFLSCSHGETWVDICKDSAGHEYCDREGGGMGDTASRHLYWIMKTPGSWADLDLYCRIERTGAKLAVLETRRENDCLIKYLLDKYEDPTSQMFAIGLKTETSFTGIYQWDRVDVAPDDQDAATLSFTNWLPVWFGSPLGNKCVAMMAGLNEAGNGRWKDIDCDMTSLYGVCEYSA